MNQFQTDSYANSAGSSTRITCTLCGWNITTCDRGSVIATLYPLRDQHTETCAPPATVKPPCDLTGCVTCTPEPTEHRHYRYESLGYIDFLWYHTEKDAREAATSHLGGKEFTIVSEPCTSCEPGKITLK